MHFSKRLDRFGDEIFAALNNRKMELEQQGMKIYNMSVGTPDFKTPEHIKKALAEAAMDDENWKYSLRDIPELLDAVCEYYQKRFQVEITPDMVMSVYGSQEGMGHLGMAICDEGDTVLLPDPCYPVFAAGSLMAGAVPYYYPLTAEHDFLPCVKDIPEDVAKKAKYMIVSLPSNPVGSVATPGLYEEIVEFGRKYDILIIHDNASGNTISLLSTTTPTAISFTTASTAEVFSPLRERKRSAWNFSAFPNLSMSPARGSASWWDVPM